MAPRFADRKVSIVFDCDREGREAAKRVADDLSGAASDVRVLELDASRDDGFDLSDFAAAATTANGRSSAQRMVLDMAERTVPLGGESDQSAAAPANSAQTFRFTPLSAFLAHEYPQAEPLLGRTGCILMAAGSLLLLEGDDGSGKSTWSLDAIAHLAAGVDWLGILVPRPIRFCVVELEGPPALFQQKLAAKADGWEGPQWRDNVHVFTAPWAASRSPKPRRGLH